MELAASGSRRFIFGTHQADVMGLQISGALYASNYYYSSDRKLKKDIKPLESSLEKISKLNGYNFTWKSTDEKAVGLIAQEVEEVYPELVGETEDAQGQTIKTVQYGNLVAPLIESTKELDAKLIAQEKRIQELEEKLEIQNTLIERLLEQK